MKTATHTTVTPKDALPALNAPLAALPGIGWLWRMTPWKTGVTSRCGRHAELMAPSLVGDDLLGPGRRVLRWWDQAAQTRTSRAHYVPGGIADRGNSWSLTARPRRSPTATEQISDVCA
jgi:hypothetical protein